MKRKFKQWWSTISTKQITTSHLKQVNTKKDNDMMLEVLAWDRHKYGRVKPVLIGSQNCHAWWLYMIRIVHVKTRHIYHLLIFALLNDYFSEDKEHRFSSSKMAVIAIMKSWPGKYMLKIIIHGSEWMSDCCLMPTW